MGELRTHKGHAPSSGAAPPPPQGGRSRRDQAPKRKITLVEPHRHKALSARLVGDLEQHGRTAGFLGLADGGGEFFDRSHLLLVDLDDQLARDKSLLGGVAAFGQLGDNNALGRITEAEFFRTSASIGASSKPTRALGSRRGLDVPPFRPCAAERV